MKKRKKTFKRIKSMIKPYWKTVVFVTILALLIDVLALAKPYLIRVLIDEFLKNGVEQKEFLSVSIIAYIYIGLVLMENFLDYFNSTRTNIIGESVVYDLRNKMYAYMEKASIKFHDKMPSGTLFVRIISDIEDIYALFSEVVTTIIKDIFIIVGLIGVMIYISYKLAAASLIIIPLIIIASLVMTKLLNKTYDAVKNVRTKMNIFFSESIYGLKVIKIFNRQKEKKKECEDVTDQFRKAMKPLGFLQGLLPALMVLIENLGIALVVWAVVNNWIGESLEVGVIYMFVTYLRSLFDPINRIIENVEIVEEAVTSIDKVYAILDKEELLEDFDSGKRVDKIKGKIEFKNVWFAYEGENWILKDVSFTIEPGQSVALVGKTGSGKTTITNLINKFYTIQKGEILIDGININDINLADLRRNIGTILQDPFIYAKSIKDNIKLFNNIPDDKIEEAVKLASANEFIENQENGIEEIARERGNSFSAGEKQLLAFARIFALNPSVFILDEATANIDTTTEQLIQESVDKLSKEKTSIFIAHRLATIVNVDKIIVLNNGKIVEEGNHEELVASGGYYSKLYNSYYNSLV